jgi:hypothetical protein
MADKVITIAGQRVKVAPFTDYYLELIKLLFDGDGKLVFELKRHSDLIAMAVEVVAPTLPKSTYRKVGEVYRWVASFEAFSELVTGLWLCYWEFELEAAEAAKSSDRVEMAQMQIGLVRAALEQSELGTEPPAPTWEELRAELEELRAKVSATA